MSDTLSPQIKNIRKYSGEVVNRTRLFKVNHPVVEQCQNIQEEITQLTVLLDIPLTVLNLTIILR